MYPHERMAVIGRVRALAASSLYRILKAEAAGESSESKLRDRWQELLREECSLFPHGWYEPPPYGISIIIARPDEFERMNYRSLRAEDMWPKEENRLHNDCLIYAYASPVDRDAGLIGDLGVTLYKGARCDIREHLATCLNVTLATAAFAEVGMELRDVFQFASERIRELGLVNQTYSISDPDGLDVGHTIPWSDVPPNTAEKCCLRSDNWALIAKLISSKRRFINKTEQFRIPSTFAFTIEPRLASENAPLVSFHVLVLIDDGRKRIVTGFAPLFELFGMDAFLREDDVRSLDTE
jgi:hypothetical protein